MCFLHWTLSQVEIDKAPQEKTAFVTHHGLFELEKMPFGLRNVPATSQHLMGNCVGWFSMKNVTGYWKTDHNVTLGQWHFTGSANSHTHALSMHCCITGLS